ncbi:aromatic aminobenezylarsenical efflux permease ArsG family transporter [Haloferula sp. A504]|uniref:aromatic aminobenezylarsenical efflux permease ArsG family transporter n=1 Tax=Haloferula sp. A504 TaxID=3373601 RepID=UPI0031BEEE72|nr:aromatic aminobenezylarsenical efflux permease ArsG family transporter [Verrucomicrobiaceae bacterium E54]
MTAEESMLLVSGGALWLGLLTAVSPCPLATNVAAISYMARDSRSPLRTLAAGLLYSLGRMVAYTLVGAIITGGLLSAPAVSGFLQRHLGQLMGPLLILTGMILLGLIPGLPGIGMRDGPLTRRLAQAGPAGAAGLGFLFALAFCPVSAALFFGSLLPLAVRNESIWLLPGVFGFGSAAPVVVFVVLLAFARRAAGKGIEHLKSADRWLLPLSGWLLVGLGVWMSVSAWL